MSDIRMNRHVSEQLKDIVFHTRVYYKIMMVFIQRSFLPKKLQGELQIVLITLVHQS